MWAVHQIVLVEQAYNVVMHAFLSCVTWQAVQVIGDVTVRVVVQENLSSLETAFTCCQKQRRLLLNSKKKKRV